MLTFCCSRLICSLKCVIARPITRKLSMSWWLSLVVTILVVGTHLQWIPWGRHQNQPHRPREEGQANEEEKAKGNGSWYLNEICCKMFSSSGWSFRARRPSDHYRLFLSLTVEWCWVFGYANYRLIYVCRFTEHRYRSITVRSFFTFNCRLVGSKGLLADGDRLPCALLNSVNCEWMVMRERSFACLQFHPFRWLLKHSLCYAMEFVSSFLVQHLALVKLITVLSNTPSDIIIQLTSRPQK